MLAGLLGFIPLNYTAHNFLRKYHANLLSFQNPKMFVCQLPSFDGCKTLPEFHFELPSQSQTLLGLKETERG